MPKVSIITPCHNAELYVGQMIESVLAQTISDWEHILVDDGSTDGSNLIVRSYLKQDSRLRLLEQQNRGVANARNNGFQCCSQNSEYLYFLDADDVLEPNMLQVMVAYLDAHPEVGLAYCDFTCIDSRGLMVERDFDSPRFAPTTFGVRVLPNTEPQTPFESVFCWAPVMESMSVLRRSIYERTPGWDEALGQHGEGIDLFLHFALLSEVHFVPKQLYRYRRHSRQSSNDSRKHQLQPQKIEAKWRNMTGLTHDQRKVVQSAITFQNTRLRSFRSFHAATSYLKCGAFRTAARTYISAGYYYLSSFFR